MRLGKGLRQLANSAAQLDVAERGPPALARLPGSQHPPFRAESSQANQQARPNEIRPADRLEPDLMLHGGTIPVASTLG